MSDISDALVDSLTEVIAAHIAGDLHEAIGRIQPDDPFEDAVLRAAQDWIGDHGIAAAVAGVEEVRRAIRLRRGHVVLADLPKLDALRLTQLVDALQAAEGERRRDRAEWVGRLSMALRGLADLAGAAVIGAVSKQAPWKGRA